MKGRHAECAVEGETWELVLDRCVEERKGERGIGERIREILDEERNGEEWMKAMDGAREQKRRKEAEISGGDEERGGCMEE